VSVLSRRRFVQGAGVTGLGLVAGCGRLPWEVAPAAKYLLKNNFVSATPGASRSGLAGVQ